MNLNEFNRYAEYIINYLAQDILCKVTVLFLSRSEYLVS